MDLAGIMHRMKARLLRRRVAVEDVEDIIQSAMLRMHQYQLGGETIREPEAFLHTTSTRLAIDAFRRDQRVQEVTLEEEHHASAALDLSTDPSDLVELQARLAHLARGLDQLNDKTRRILLARRLEGRSTREIAQHEEMTIAAVEKQIARGTYRLMKWMDDQ